MLRRDVHVCGPARAPCRARLAPPGPGPPALPGPGATPGPPEAPKSGPPPRLAPRSVDMHQRKRGREPAAPSLGRLIEAEGKELLRLAAKAYFVCKTDQELDDLKVLVEGIASQEAARVAARRGPAAAGAPAVEAAVGGAGGEGEAAVPGTAAAGPAVEAAAVEAEAAAAEEGGEEADAAAPVPVEAQTRAAKELLAALNLVPARSRSSLGLLYVARVLARAARLPDLPCLIDN